MTCLRIDNGVCTSYRPSSRDESILLVPSALLHTLAKDLVAFSLSRLLVATRWSALRSGSVMLLLLSASGKPMSEFGQDRKNK